MEFSFGKFLNAFPELTKLISQNGKQGGIENSFIASTLYSRYILKGMQVVLCLPIGRVLLYLKFKWISDFSETSD